MMEDRGRTLTPSEAIAESKRLDLDKALALLRMVRDALYAEGAVDGAGKVEAEIARRSRSA